MKLEEQRNSINEKLAKNKRKKEKKRRRLLKEGQSLPPEQNSPPIMADTETINGAENNVHSEPAEPIEPVVDLEEQERKEEEERKKNREPPIVYKDAIDVSKIVYIHL